MKQITKLPNHFYKFQEQYQQSKRFINENQARETNVEQQTTPNNALVNFIDMNSNQRT